MNSAAAVPPAPRPRAGGDVDLAAIGALLADPGRCRILLALDDGRALPASRLATEAGVTAATASSHLGKLTSAGLLAVERHGRYRYYRLAGPPVAQLIETLGQLAPAVPIRSLREDTSAAALRRARTCYDHLAGRLGTALMHSFLEARWLTGGNGHYHPDDADPRAGYGSEYDYRLTETGVDFLNRFGARIPARRRVISYCVDWTEQRHHLSGGLGRGLLERLTELGWIRSSRSTRAVEITDAGSEGLRDTFDIDLTEAPPNLPIETTSSRIR
jgi:DNA-binding transcriptional ArsR family regulator